MHCTRGPDGREGDRPTRPMVVVTHHPHRGDHTTLREIHAGLEEEGVPARTEMADREPTTSLPIRAIALAQHAAETSPLDVGVGLAHDGTVCVHHAKLPTRSPALIAAADSARVLGHNAARLVVGIPLKQVPNGVQDRPDRPVGQEPAQ